MTKFKSYIVVFLVFLIPSTAACFSFTDIFTATHADWNFIEDVGGLQITYPEYKPGEGWYFSAKCDVSGVRTITTKPKLLNSALAIKKIKARVIKRRIQIWVVYCLASKDFPSAYKEESIFLGGIEEGLYQIEYLNDNGTVVPITDVEFKLGQDQQKVPADAKE